MKLFHFHNGPKLQKVAVRKRIGRVFVNDHDCIQITLESAACGSSTGDHERGALTYTTSGRWQNRSEFVKGRTDITKCLATEGKRQET
jgi:nuclear transport factor 2 (NTF2) superfamily protein